MKLLFIYNPMSGKAKIKTYLHEIIDIFIRAGYTVTVHATQKKGDAAKIVKEREKGIYDLVVCSGGDGTLDEVVNGMMKSEEKVPIGYIPAGSTNDFAQSLDISNDMLTAAKNIVDGKVFHCDIGKFNGEAFAYIAAFGLFTEVSYETDQQLKNILGHIAYILEGVKSLSSVKTYNMQFESKEYVLKGNFLYGMITNSVSVGGFKNLVGDNVELDDGKFEVTFIECPGNLVELHNIVHALISKKPNSHIHSFKTSDIHITCEEKVCWTLDGEYAGAHTEVNIKNYQKELPFVVNFND